MRRQFLQAKVKIGNKNKGHVGARGGGDDLQAS